MTIEENLPEKFKLVAFHPSLFVYAWKRNTLDKLFEEFMQSNIAITGGEAWIAEGEISLGVIPLKNGSKAVLNWKTSKKSKEDWYDFIERSIKESLSKIAEADLEKKVTAKIRNKLWYQFHLEEGS